jgi:fructan beta-fructosidase
VKWRNAMTIPRGLHIKHVGDDLYVASEPVRELNKIESAPAVSADLKVTDNYDLSHIAKQIHVPFRLNLSLDEIRDFSLVLSNNANEKLIIGYDKSLNQYFIDRTGSGKVDFEKGFSAKHLAPRLTAAGGKIELSIIVDESSVELFADDGLTVMTEIVFPSKPYDQLHIQTHETVVFKKLEYINLKSIWQ